MFNLSNLLTQLNSCVNLSCEGCSWILKLMLFFSSVDVGSVFTTYMGILVSFLEVQLSGRKAIKAFLDVALWKPNQK